jgi:hypothetical protein
MTVAQKVPFELVALHGPAGGHGLGYGQSSGAAEQSPGGHGQYARHHAGASRPCFSGRTGRGSSCWMADVTSHGSASVELVAVNLPDSARRFINERRAINLDANCGWARGKADVLSVADVFEVMRKLKKLLVVRQRVINIRWPAQSPVTPC